MAKEVIVVYQDCFLCGDKGKQKIAELAAEGIRLRKVGFSTAEGQELIHQAVMVHGIKTMPFFTDGETFAATLEPFRKAKKSQKVDIPAEDEKKTAAKATGGNITVAEISIESLKKKGKKHVADPKA